MIHPPLSENIETSEGAVLFHPLVCQHTEPASLFGNEKNLIKEISQLAKKPIWKNHGEAISLRCLRTL